MQTALPSFLTTEDAFRAHLREQFEDASNDEKGSQFLAFILSLLPLCDVWGACPRPIANPKKSHDKGVDFVADPQGDKKYGRVGQSKFSIREISELDTIFSKFEAYEKTLRVAPSKQTLLLPGEQPSPPGPTYYLCTGSQIESLVAKYSASSLSATKFFGQIKREGRVVILDCADIHRALVDLYRRSFLLAPEVEIALESELIRDESVYIAIASGATLRHLYRAHGNSLFFENIREYLGTATASSSAREGVNDDIESTLRQAPGKMLGRNNGITFRAESVEVVSPRLLRLRQCGIVNGCQTTMSIVGVGTLADTAHVLIKVVESDDSWDVAKATNYQNAVSRIELDLARYLRPQIVAKAATDAGLGTTDATVDTVARVLEAVHTQKVSYEAMKLLYLGLFSRYPNNMFESNYVELRTDILGRFYREGRPDFVMSVVFRLLRAMNTAISQMESRFPSGPYRELFGRFFKDDKLQYRCLLAVLTVCVCVKLNVAERSAVEDEGYRKMDEFLRRTEALLENHSELFSRVFLQSFSAIAGKVFDSGTDGTPQELSQRMYREVMGYSGTKFNNLIGKVTMALLVDDSVNPLMERFEAEHPTGG